MSPFITGILFFLLIAVAMGAVMFWAVRSQAGKEFRISRRAFVYSLVIPVVLGVAFLGFFAFYEWHETPGFCGELCHAMGPKYEGYEEPENNAMMITHKEEGVPCTGCHVGPGWTGQVTALMSVPHEFISEAFNLYDIDDLGGIMQEEQCWKCHDGSHAIKPGKVYDVLGDPVDPHTGEEKCFNCHPAHSAGFGVSLDTCVLCHGHALGDWDAAMERHGSRTGGNCLDCHDRHHPEDARVPWDDVADILENEGMDFCADCHPRNAAEWVASSNEASHELYGDCFNCHTEHLSSHAFHVDYTPYDNCSNCHPSFAAAGDIHDRTGVTYANVADVGNDLCEACHVDEVEDLDENKQHRGLDCVYCHGDHLVRIQVTFGECTVCHDDRIEEGHDETTDNCTAGACHGRGWFH